MSMEPPSAANLSSVITTLTLANSLLLEELGKKDPEAARRISRVLNGYAGYVETKYGPESPDAKSTRAAVQMLTTPTGNSEKDETQ